MLFRSVASATCAGTQRTLPANLGFVNNRISPALLNPVALNILKTFPAPINDCGRVLYGLVAKTDEQLVTTKLDWQVSDKHSFFGRYISANLNQGSTYDGKNPLSINQYGVHDLDYGFAFGDTYLISNNLINSLHFGANRTNVSKINDVYQSWAGFGANVSPLADKMIAITAPGAFVLGGGGASPGSSANGPLW